MSEPRKTVLDKGSVPVYRFLPSGKMLKGHMVIIVPKVTGWLIVAGVGLALLASVARSAAW